MKWLKSGSNQTATTLNNAQTQQLQSDFRSIFEFWSHAVGRVWCWRVTTIT
jgi:hypothetical protein